MAPIIQESEIRNRFYRNEIDLNNYNLNHFNGNGKNFEAKSFEGQNFDGKSFDGFDGFHDTVLSKIEEKVGKIDINNCLPNEENSFFIVNLNEIKKSLDLWNQYLPNIKPHYAVKCNNNLKIIKMLHDLGINFDCASQNEIEYILELGISPDKIIYANPVKTISYLNYAKRENIQLTTVDNIDELYKIKKTYPEIGILIRIVTDDESAQCRLSTKFGCDIPTAIEMLKTAYKLGLNIKGVAFHIGSGSKDNDSIHTAIKDSKYIFNENLKLGLPPLSILDIGGGFERETFKNSANMINYSLGKFFPPEFVDHHQIKFIAEPGRFVVSNAFTLVTNVIGKRSQDSMDMLYINDGVYGNLNCIIYDHQNPVPMKFSKSSAQADEEDLEDYSIWGPTCDGLDKIGEFKLPKTNIGDWLFFKNVGAYTSVASTSFNGFFSNEFVYVE